MITLKLVDCTSGIAVDCWKVMERYGTGGKAYVCEACKKKKHQEYSLKWQKNKRLKKKRTLD